MSNANLIQAITYVIAHCKQRGMSSYGYNSSDFLNTAERYLEAARKELPKMPEPEPTYQDGFYWFSSERSTYNSIAQCINNEWYIINEPGPITIDELRARGWRFFAAVSERDENEENY